MTRGGLRARTAAGRRAQVRRTPSAPRELVLLSGPRVDSRLDEVPSGRARGRPGDGGGAGEPRPGRGLNPALRGRRLRSESQTQGRRARTLGPRALGEAGSRGLHAQGFGVECSQTPSPPTCPSFLLPASGMQLGGSCSRVASGVGLRAPALRCLWPRRGHLQITV